MGVGSEYLKYLNQGATRKLPLNPVLEQRIADAISNVYGPGYTAQIYSGGQPGKGEGPRVGSVRHDHGKAGDIYVVGPDGKRVTGDALAPLGQYWQAKKYGGTGMEMRGGGIHLDMWEKPPPGGGMTWNYANQRGRFTPAQREALALGQKGVLPGGAQQMAMAMAQPNPTPAPAAAAINDNFMAGNAAPVPVAKPMPEMAGGAGNPLNQFPDAPVQKTGLIPMLQSGQPINMDTAKSFLGGANGPAATAAAGVGNLVAGLAAAGNQAPPPAPAIDAHDPDASLLALLDPKRKRMMASGLV